MTDALTQDAIDWLGRLVAIDTSNPPRLGAHNAEALGVVCGALAGHGFTFQDFDWDDGCLGLLAVRERGDLLVNCHLDTVPAADGWTTPSPWTLTQRDQRLIGLGACDVKGAAAAVLAACRAARGDIALLFTTDEEAGESRCVHRALAEISKRDDRLGQRGVIVSEPTMCRAVVAHRGLATSTGRFNGTAGHSSAARAITDSAVHESVRWAAKALEYATERQSDSNAILPGVCFNMGRIEGGIKNNMIATEALVRFGVRPGPGESCESVLDAIEGLADADRVQWERGFCAPPLPSSERAAEQLTEARALASSLGLEAGTAVDFWTEGALFSQAGFTAMVMGPGSISEAHRADESVAIAQLATCAATYARLLSS